MMAAGIIPIEAIRDLPSRDNIIVIRHHENLGYGQSIISGMQKAQGQIVLIMDADGRINISDVDSFLPYLDQYDIVTGYRRDRKDSNLQSYVRKDL